LGEISSFGFDLNSTVSILWGVFWPNWAIHTFWGSSGVGGFNPNTSGFLWVY